MEQTPVKPDLPVPGREAFQTSPALAPFTPGNVAADEQDKPTGRGTRTVRRQRSLSFLSPDRKQPSHSFHSLQQTVTSPAQPDSLDDSASTPSPPIPSAKKHRATRRGVELLPSLSEAFDPCRQAQAGHASSAAPADTSQGTGDDAAGTPMLISPRPSAPTDDITLPTPDRFCPPPTARPTHLQQLQSRQQLPPKLPSPSTQPHLQSTLPHSGCTSPAISDIASTPCNQFLRPHRGSAAGHSPAPPQPDFSGASPDMSATPLGPVAAEGLGVDTGERKVGTHLPAAGADSSPAPIAAEQQQQSAAAGGQMGEPSSRDSDPWSSDSDLDSELGEPCELRADFLQTFEPVSAFLSKLGASFRQHARSTAPAKQALSHLHPVKAAHRGYCSAQGRINSGELSKMAQGIQLQDKQPRCNVTAAQELSQKNQGGRIETSKSLPEKVPTRGITSLGELAALGIAFNAASFTVSPSAFSSGQPGQPKASLLDELWAGAQTSQPDSPPPTHKSLYPRATLTHAPTPQLESSFLDRPLGSAMSACSPIAQSPFSGPAPSGENRVQRPATLSSSAAPAITAAGGNAGSLVQSNPPTWDSPADGAAAAGAAVSELPKVVGSELGEEEEAEDEEGDSVWDVEYGDLSAEDDAEAMRKLGEAAGRIARAMMTRDRAPCKDLSPLEELWDANCQHLSMLSV
ncbi:hypothetical protein WJX74_000922 [Apatococcus lobatus]|uniref:Uncharacterized protein n=1 Tax=Apatococcus lobatus TaxID=904363 RepID=A0AAW1Q9R8_9CHLO